jgi:hypothetical protein
MINSDKADFINNYNLVLVEINKNLMFIHPTTLPVSSIQR